MLAQTAEVASDGVAGEVEIGRDAPHVGLGDPPTLDIQRRVEGDVLQDHPGRHTDSALHPT